MKFGIGLIKSLMGTVTGLSRYQNGVGTEILIPATVVIEAQFHAVVSGFPSSPGDRVRGQLVIHDPFKAPSVGANTCRR